MKRIAISQRVDVLANRGERRDAIDQNLSAFLHAIDTLAFPVPNTLQLAGLLDAWLEAIRPDGIMLSGGNDIGTELDRDDTERALLVWAEQRSLPVLGICRGMQMMAVASGAKLKPVAGHVRTRHALNGVLTGTVNSFHEHILETCPDNYDVLATTNDGVIEAISHRELPFEGWMWHPEREPLFNSQDINRARKIFDT